MRARDVLHSHVADEGATSVAARNVHTHARRRRDRDGGRIPDALPEGPPRGGESNSRCRAVGPPAFASRGRLADETAAPGDYPCRPEPKEHADQQRCLRQRAMLGSGAIPPSFHPLDVSFLGVVGSAKLGGPPRPRQDRSHVRRRSSPTRPLIGFRSSLSEPGIHGPPPSPSARPYLLPQPRLTPPCRGQRGAFDQYPTQPTEHPLTIRAMAAPTGSGGVERACVCAP